ncbi:uncharacterized protein LOC118753473 [Rhagoletis pomonella]|uniref:uncharacterized protein LOC118753473 n=1 Tax=Rhagoletis pomonella TaxID=28610 RepID=UPI0017870FAB|nr:uncharacterized protein LOC118753473 [Rhagoletis pomonella]
MPSNCRLRIFDTSTNTTFLIDSGADESIVPKCSKLARVTPSDMQLFAANGTSIPVFGEVMLKLNLNLRRDFIWSFVIAGVSQAIIGADFLSYYSLLLDLKMKCLIDRKTTIKTVCSVTHIDVPRVSTISQNFDFSNLLKEFSDITRPAPFEAASKSTVVHRIITTGQPVSSRPRRLSPEKLRKARAEFDLLMRLEYAGHPAATGQAHYTWCTKVTVHGGLVVTTEH